MGMVAFDNPNHLITKVGRTILLGFGFKKKLKSGCLISNKEVHLAQDYSCVYVCIFMCVLVVYTIFIYSSVISFNNILVNQLPYGNCILGFFPPTKVVSDI